ncbi:MAG: hypothetical protein RLZZ28_466 [Bacteroidota bacterium]|jgi:hypothetical protein
MSYYFRILAFKISYFLHMWITNKNKLGLRICILYVEKKIFYSLVFLPITTVWALERFFCFLPEKL